MKHLIIAAHPDDEVLGCGGLIARLSGDGQEVHCGILGEGLTSRFKSRQEADENSIKRLKEKTLASAKILGVADCYFHDLPDNRFDTQPLLDIVKMIEDLIALVEPDKVFTQSKGDLNIDHSITFRATLTACRPTNASPVKTLYTYEVPSSTEWSFGTLRSDFRPNVFVDITETLPAKLEALACYDTEMRSFPHPRSKQAIVANAQRWGSVAGFQAAEAFQLVYSRW